MTINETRFKITRILIEGVLYNYSTRKDNYVSLRSILGDYSNNITRRAIREAMFDKLTILEMVKNKRGDSKVKTKTMWVLKTYKEFDPKNAKHDYLSFITYRTLEEAERLTELIRKVHGWSPKVTRDFNVPSVNKHTINETFVTFKLKYNYLVKNYALEKDPEYQDKLMKLIYDYGTDMARYMEIDTTKKYVKERDELIKKYEEKLEKAKNLLNEMSEKLKIINEELIR